MHYIWATWQRLPLIAPNVEWRVYDTIVVKCRELKCEPIAIGGTEDHIHLLVQLASVTSVAKLVQEVKGASSHLMNHELTPNTFFRWQISYGALTVDKPGLPRLETYIRNQKTHHQQGLLMPEWEVQ
ncbi:MAG TPA: IS200/IS605 family transposase [Chloroflexia bacterium]